ncbi:MAG: hypothetical protein N2201_05295 [candidate division WOR-3 bacterium]|nr:hypothetical protein [candidate division WOR-3 bacterium]
MKIKKLIEFNTKDKMKQKIILLWRYNCYLHLLICGGFLVFLSSIPLSCKKPIEESIYQVVSRCANPGYAQSVYVTKLNNKDYAFVASGQAGLVIYDVNNPEQPYIKAQWMDSANTCWSVMTLNNYAYLAYGSKLYVKLNVTNLDSIKTSAVFSSVGYVAYAYDIFATDTNLIGVAARERLFIYDLTDPFFPNYSTLSLPRCIRGIFIKDSFAYLACEQLGVSVVKIKWTPNPNVELISNIDTPSNARSLFVKDNTCYVADGRGGLVMIDISAPTFSSIISRLDLPGYAQRVYVKDTLAYLACGDAGLCVVNVKDKNKPYLVETVKTSYAKGVFVNNEQIIFVADRDEGLVIIKSKK